MLNHIIAFCLKNRVLVLAVTVVLVIYGGKQAMELPIDVFPNLNRPTVTIMVEAHGLAPEEVETLVTFPIESAMNGASDAKATQVAYRSVRYRQSTRRSRHFGTPSTTISSESK